MIATRALVMLGIAALLAGPGCYDDVKVVQGAVVTSDGPARTLSVQDERAPHAVATYQVADALLAKPGDIVRLAYRDRGQARVVARMMNVTRVRSKKEQDK